MASWTDIANLTLLRLGKRAIVDIDTDPSNAAEKIRGVYPALADVVLYAAPWKCALSRAVIAADTATPAFGPSYQYSLPTDPWCLRPWKVGDGCEWYGEEDGRWQVEGRKILTDISPPLNLRFIYRVTDPNLFAGPLIVAMSRRIGWEVGFYLTNDRALTDEMEQEYERIVAEAKSLDSMQGTPPRYAYESDVLRSRY